MTGNIFNIQRFSIHDGPGIRTTVFLKGCNLRCIWCHNPESQSFSPVLMFYKNKCVGCGKCTEICKNAFTDKCTGCGKCTKVCEKGAKIISGEEMSSERIFDIIKKDKEFYNTSGGGVTFSGGEPLLQSDFLVEVLKMCKAENIKTAIETAANVNWSIFEKVLPFVDLVICDVKCIDEDKHKKLTGVSNKLILENAKKLMNSGKDILFRMPVIPGYNMDEVGKVADFVKGFDLELMAYHKIGYGKYDALKKENLTFDVEPPTQDEMKELAKKYNAIFSPSGT